MAFVSSFTTSSKPTSLNSSSFVTGLRPETTKNVDIYANRLGSKHNAPRMIFGFSLFSLPETVALPQHDKVNAHKRTSEIKENQEEYKWSREVIGDSPMIDGLPREEIPAIGWIHGMAKTIFRVVSNNLAVRYADAKEDYEEEKRKLLYSIGNCAAYALSKVSTGSFHTEEVKKLLDDIGDLFGAQSAGKGSSFQEYKDLFKVYKPDKVAQLDQFLRDDVFGWYRVAGPDPLHIRKLTGPVKDMFPELTDDILRGIRSFSSDSLDEAMREGRLFYLDYPEFDGIPVGSFPDGTPKEGFHLYAPTALFAVPKEVDDRTSLLPIAIRCGQSSEYPMYTPNPAHTDEVTWLAAKCTVQVADGVMLECRYHLGRTHLLLETFVCSAKRTLAPSHPLYKFLSIHFEGTAFINYLGSLRLASPGGTIDVITSPPIEISTKLCADAIRPPFHFNNWMPDNEMASRGMLDADCLNYPYRDDALKIWPAIQEWVGAYVRAYYKSDRDVIEDYELAAWCREIVSPTAADIPGFGETEDGQIKTVAYLVKFISMLVYVGSVQHSALNFPQGSLMQFVPAMPLTGLAPAPKTPRPFKSIDHFVEEMLPDLAVAQKQLNTAELLSGYQWTALGEYGRDLNFAPDEVDEALKEFKEKLSEIGNEIQKRNAKERIVGLPVYDFLVPKNIPQSTNV